MYYKYSIIHQSFHLTKEEENIVTYLLKKTDINNF